MVELLRLLTWLSPAFPTGGFAYSSGLEWAVEHGIRDEPTLIAWIEDLLRSGSLWTDAILLRRAHRGEDVAELGLALATTFERRLETSAQGSAFVLAAAAWPGTAWDDDPIPYPVAVGKLAAAHEIDEDSATLAFLHAAAANLISAAIRLIPLGQAAGLRCQAALEPAILQTLAANSDELGTASWAADIASMQHETQYTRLFRT
jgi:urease accessory protein